MKISARNQIEATITALDKGIVNTMITLKAVQGTQLTAIITNTSTDVLGLEVGETVTAFFKASHVLIATEAIANISARNKLLGKVEKIVLGAVNAEIDITLESGDKVVAIITDDSAVNLSLKEGSDVMAIIKSTDVMIAK